MCHINKAFPLCQHPFFLCVQTKGQLVFSITLFFMSFLSRALFVQPMMVIRPIQVHGRKPMVMAHRLYSSRPMDQPSTSKCFFTLAAVRLSPFLLTATHCCCVTSDKHVCGVLESSFHMPILLLFTHLTLLHLLQNDPRSPSRRSTACISMANLLL